MAKKKDETETVSVICKRSLGFWDPKDPTNIKKLFVLRPFSDSLRRLPFGVQELPSWIAQTDEFQIYLRDGSLILVGSDN